jgi:hypothetical protein
MPSSCNDAEFLTSLGIAPDVEWLCRQSASSPEQRQYVEDLLRLNRLLGGGMQLTLPSVSAIPPGEVNQ